MPKAMMLGVRDGLVQERGDMIVMQRVDDLAPHPLPDHESEVAKHPQLVRDRGELHLDRLGKIADRGRGLTQTREDPHPTRRSQRLHRLRDLTRILRR